ncbi:11779_t:CDS:1, partial [Dentiscutata erythropus]
KQKKPLQELESEESQAKGELLIANADVALDVLIVLTNCNDKWTLFFITKNKEKYLIVTENIDDCEKTLSIIKNFVLEQGIKFNKILGTNVRSLEAGEIKISPLSKTVKFEEVFEFCDKKMFGMISDMTDDELHLMNM